MNNTLSIYVHIPFCESKCIYCNFVSNICDEQIKQKYFDRLLKEIEEKSPLFLNKEVVSIYIGGGTPSCVQIKYIENIINTIKLNYKLNKNCEISIECNPNSVNKEKLSFYKSLGINRISFGVQSLNNKNLKLIGRLHNKKTALNSIKLAKEVGFDNISCDLLLGLPNSSKRNIIKDIKKLIKYGIKHISCYMLIVEDNTVLFKKVKNNEMVLPSEEETVNQYNSIVKYLKKYNFIRYEISNFAYPNYECLHNKRYWNLSEYVGFGISAHSFYNGKRIENVSSFNEYNIEFEKNTEVLSKTQMFEEYIMLSLRTNNGINLNYINEKFKIDLLKTKSNEIKFLLDNKFIEIIEDNIRIKDDKFGVANQIILKLI